jgi:Right handed beta helix region
MAQALAAQAGDTIALSSGVFRVSLRFGNSGTADRPIVVAGTDSTTVLMPQPGLGILYISGQHSIRVSGVVFDSSNASGTKVENGSTDIVFDGCVFRNNALDGLEITDSDVRAAHCTFVRNGRAGITVNGDGSGAHTVVLDNVLSAHNVKEGMAVTAAPVSVTRATVSDNDSCGIGVTTPAGTVRIVLSIVSFNAGAGIAGLWSASAAQLSFDSLDVYSNLAAFDLSPVVSPQYFAWDPMFANRDLDDYAVGAASEIYGMEQQGIVVGYRK